MLQDYAKIQPEVQKEIQTALGRFESTIQKEQQFRISRIQNHRHTGVDAGKVEFADLNGKILTLYWTIPGTNAATAANYSTIFTAPFPCSVTAMTEVHATAGTNLSDVTLQLERLTGTEAPGAGDEILYTPINLKATANTVQEAVISPVRTTGVGVGNLATGDRLALKRSGTLTSVANVTVVIQLLY